MPFCFSPIFCTSISPLFATVDLAKVLTSEAMAPILSKPEVQEQLIPFLPEGESLPKDPEQLRLTLQSPQFKQVSGAART